MEVLLYFILRTRTLRDKQNNTHYCQVTVVNSIVEVEFFIQ